MQNIAFARRPINRMNTGDGRIEVSKQQGKLIVKFIQAGILAKCHVVNRIQRFRILCKQSQLINLNYIFNLSKIT